MWVSPNAHVRVQALRAELDVWVAWRKTNFPQEQLTVPNDITLKMLGTEAQPKWRFSGAETWTMLLFLTDLVRKHQDALGRDRAVAFASSGQGLIDMILLMRRCGMSIPTAATEDLFLFSGFGFSVLGFSSGATPTPRAVPPRAGAPTGPPPPRGPPHGPPRAGPHPAGRPHPVELQG